MSPLIEVRDATPNEVKIIADVSHPLDALKKRREPPKWQTVAANVASGLARGLAQVLVFKNKYNGVAFREANKAASTVSTYLRRGGVRVHKTIQDIGDHESHLIIATDQVLATPPSDTQLVDNDGYPWG